MNRNWLIRKSDLKISRPISHAEMMRRIEQGEVLGSDEVCESAGYWFYLNDVQEVRAHFGEIQLERLFPKGSMDDTGTDSTDTRRLSSTHLIETTGLRSAPSKEVFKAAEPQEMPSNVRIRNALGVVIFFLIFFGFLWWIWSGSY